MKRFFQKLRQFAIGLQASLCFQFECPVICKHCSSAHIVLFTLSVLLIAPPLVSADPKHQNVRRTESTLRKKGDSVSANLGSQLSGRGHGSAGDFNSGDLQLDTVESAILSGRKDNRLIRFYRGLIYSKYFQDSSRADSFADLESQSFAEDLLSYQTTRTLRWLVENSGIARIYDNFIVTYSKFTTASFERRVDGSVGLADSNSSKRKFLQLKLHASTRNGIEPRLIIDDRVTLRYDLLHQQALLEYQINF